MLFNVLRDWFGMGSETAPDLLLMLKISASENVTYRTNQYTYVKGSYTIQLYSKTLKGCWIKKHSGDTDAAEKQNPETICL